MKSLLDDGSLLTAETDLDLGPGAGEWEKDLRSGGSLRGDWPGCEEGSLSYRWRGQGMQGRLLIAKDLGESFSVEGVPASSGAVSYPLPNGRDEEISIEVRVGGECLITFTNAN